MENKKSKGKIIALICSLVVAVGLVTTGVVLAATGALSGLFSSDKAKAFDLLAEVPGRVTYSATNDELGMDEMITKMLGKGMDLDLKISDIKTTESGTTDLSGFSMNLGAQIDLANKKIGAKMAVGKDGANLSAEGYASLDEKKAAFSLPELIPNKVFAMTASDTQSQDALTRFSEVLAMLPELQDSLGEFIDEQGDALYDGTECTRIPNGYRLLIPKASMDGVLTKLQSWASGQQAAFGSIEDKLGISKGTIVAGINAMVPALTTYTKDFTFEIYEQDGKLSGISTNIKIEDVNVECPISATFNENGEQQEVTVNIELMQDGNSMGKVVYTGLSKGGSICEDTRKITVSEGENELVSYDERTTLDKKNNNAFEVNSSMKMNGKETMSLVASGNIKNLEKGKCVTLQYDEAKVEQQSLYGSKSTMSYVMEVTMAVLDGDVAMISGDEIGMTPDTIDSVLSPYEKEVMKNFSAILKKWGISDSTGLSPSLLNPVMNYYELNKIDSSSDSDSSDSDSYDPDDYDHGEYDEDYDGDEDDDDEYADYDSDIDSDADSQSDDDSESTDDSESQDGDGSDLDDMF